MSALKVADTQMTQSQKKLRELERASFAARRAMKEIKLDPSQSLTTQTQATLMEKALHGVYRQALETDKAMDGIGFNAGDVAAFVAESEIIKRELREIKRDADETRRSMAAGALLAPAAVGRRSQFVGFGGRGGFLPAHNYVAGPAGSFPGESGSYSVSPAERARLNAEYFARFSPFAPHAASAARAAAAALAPSHVFGQQSMTGMAGMFGASSAAAAGMTGRQAPAGSGLFANPRAAIAMAQTRRGINPAFDDIEKENNISGALAYLGKKGIRLSGRELIEGSSPSGSGGGILSGGGGRRGGRDGGNLLTDLYRGGGRYSKGGRYNVPGLDILAGILPGGARARPAALAAAAGAALTTGPVAGPALAGGAIGLAAGAGALLGGLGTLKLAFSGITAEAFKTQKAFDKLTPTQKAFVQTLRSLDAGLGRVLKGIAQQTVLSGFTKAIHSAVTPASSAVLAGGVGAFSGALSGGAQQAGKLFGSVGFAKEFGAVMQADARYLRDLLDGVIHLASAFVTLMAAAIPLTDWLDKGLLRLAKWADTSIKASAASGSLAKFMDTVRISMSALGAIAYQVGRIFGAFFQAVGFANSLLLIHDLSMAFKILADLIFANKKLIGDLLKGILLMVGDALQAIRLLGGAFTWLLRPIDRLIEAVGGFRIILDGLLLFWVATLIPKMLASLSLFILGIGTTLPAAAEGGALAAGAAVEGLGVTIAAVLPEMAAVIAAAYAAYKLIEWIRNKRKQNKAEDELDKAGFVQDPTTGQWVRGSTRRKNQKDIINGIIRGDPLPKRNHLDDLADWVNKQPKVIGDPTGMNIPVDPATAMFNKMMAQWKKLLGKPFATPKQLDQGSGELLPQNLQLALAKASTTKTTRDDVKAIGAAIKNLQSRMKTFSPSDKVNAYQEIKALQDELKSLVNSVTPSFGGIGILPPGLRGRVLGAQTRAGQFGSISKNTPFNSEAYRAAKGLVVQLTAGVAYLNKLETDPAILANKKKLLAVQKEELVLTKQLTAAKQDVKDQEHIRDRDKIQAQMMRLAGLGPGPTSVSAQRVIARERAALIAIVKRQSAAQRAAAPHRRGVHVPNDPFSSLPGAGNMTIPQLIQGLEHSGVKFTKAAQKDFSRIASIVALAQKTNTPIKVEVLNQINAWLKQIADNTNPSKLTAHPNSYRFPSIKELMKGLKGSFAVRHALAQRLAEVELNEGKTHHGQSAFGYPGGTGLGTSHGGHGRYKGMTSVAASRLGSDAGQHVVVQHNTIHVHGYQKDERVLAKEIHTELSKQSRRNSTQTKGPNAGRNRNLN